MTGFGDYPRQTVFVGGYTIDTLSVRLSVTFCFLNSLKETLIEFNHTLQTYLYYKDKYLHNKK